MKRQVITVTAVCLLAAGISAVYAAWMITRLRSVDARHSVSDWRSAPTDATQPILEKFTLTDSNGEQFNSSELDGKVWVASFFFASCPGSCKQQNELVRQLQDEFGPRDVTFVSITCDPEVDTPERLKSYAADFGAHQDQWRFLTGNLDYIRRVGGEYFRMLVHERGHQDRFALVDRDGRIRGYFDWHSQTELTKLKETIEQCLAADASGEDA